jgi:hypothetical protein
MGVRRAQAITAMVAALASVAAAGCGSGSAPHDRGRTTAVAPPASPAAVEAFRRHANGTCIQAYDRKRLRPVRSSSPGAMRTYAIQALPIAERMDAGLRRIAPPTGPRGVPARQVALGWSQLADMLRQTARGGPGQAPRANAIAGLERNIAEQALSIGLDACAPPVS